MSAWKKLLESKNNTACKQIIIKIIINKKKGKTPQLERKRKLKSKAIFAPRDSNPCALKFATRIEPPSHSHPHVYFHHTKYKYQCWKKKKKKQAHKLARRTEPNIQYTVNLVCLNSTIPSCYSSLVNVIFKLVKSTKSS